MLDRKQKFILAVSFAAILFFVAGNFVATKMASQSPFRPLAIFGEVVSHVSHDYVEEVDEKKVMNGAIAGFLEGLDPMCSYIEKSGVAQYETVKKSAESSPISITKRYGYGFILHIEPGSPAEEAGLKRGDFIRAINKHSTRDMGLFQLQAALSGPPPIECTIVRDNARGDGPTTITLKKTVMPPRPPLINTVKDGVTILTLNQMREGAAAGLRSALLADRRSGARESAPLRLALDLRGCTGNDYEEALRFLSVIISDGDIATRHDRSDKPQVYRTDSAGYVATPHCAVLVDGYTCSAPELIAASLKQRGIARLFGSRSYGTVREQRLYLFPDGSGVLLSSYEWTAADGKIITGKGVEPDVAEKETDETAPADPMLAAALSYLLSA